MTALPFSLVFSLSFVIIANLNESVLFISGKHRLVVKHVLLVNLPLAI